ncbi:MAG: AraC family transcriptional regulator [Saprospiraceae bacterium]|nr:AraC family transcriptional regulator [Saprospiraceae bacterium]
MTFEISPIQLITVCSVINGFVFAFLLFEKKENRQANRFLSLTILSTCLTFTPFILDASIWKAYEWLAWLPFSLSYWIGPAFYFYIKTLTEGPDAFQKKDLWHFIPIILNYLHSLYHAIIVNADPWPWFHHIAELLESAAIVSVLIYLVFSFKLLKSYQRSLLNNVSYTELIDLRWVNQFIYIIAGSCVLILAFITTSMIAGGKYTLQDWNDPRAFALLIYAGVLYWLSISGFKQAQTHRMVDLGEPNEQEQDEHSEVIQQLSQAIESQKLYRNPELSLSDLSRNVNISERVISNAINQELGRNFFQFINEYRVDEVKERLKDPKNDHLKILSLAFDAGFNSKASFNRVFKAYTGQTPKAYKTASSPKNT